MHNTFFETLVSEENNAVQQKQPFTPTDLFFGIFTTLKSPFNTWFPLCKFATIIVTLSETQSHRKAM